MVCAPSGIVQAKESPWSRFGSDNITHKPQALPQAPPPGICIDNGIIDICWFTEYDGVGWSYPGATWNVWHESPGLAYGANLPTPLGWSITTKYYPPTGAPDTWYEGIVQVDLDEFIPPPFSTPEVQVHREIMVPSGSKCFFARYTIRNISGHTLGGLRFFEYIDYDLGENVFDEGGYRDMACDFVWQHDIGSGVGTYAGFSGSIPSAHHDVGYYWDVGNNVSLGNLPDRTYYEGDAAVAMEWNLGDLSANGMATLTLTYCFADSFNELLNRFTPSSAPLGGGVEGSSAGGGQGTTVSTPNMNVHYVSVNPAQTIANQPVTISANVVNEGGMTGSTRVALKINGQVEQTKLVTVGPGGSRPVKFTVTKSEPGTYTVIMGSQRASFVVTEDTAKTGAQSLNGGLIAMLLFGVLAFAVIVVLMLSFRRPA